MTEEVVSKLNDDEAKVVTPSEEIINVEVEQNEINGINEAIVKLRADCEMNVATLEANKSIHEARLEKAGEVGVVPDGETTPEEVVTPEETIGG